MREILLHRPGDGFPVSSASWTNFELLLLLPSNGVLESTQQFATKNGSLGVVVTAMVRVMISITAKVRDEHYWVYALGSR